MRTKYKSWTPTYLAEHPEVQIPLDALLSFNHVYLEIGSGKGQFLLEMALKFPERFFIGVERNVTCAGFTAKKLVENQITNAKIIHEDAQKVLELMSEKSVDTIYLNFSDPWPKVRHHKRRLTSDVFASLYQKVLAHNAPIIQKTDNYDLFCFSKKHFEINNFKIIECDENYQLDNDNDVITEYESDFRKENLPIYRMKVIANERD